MITITIDETKRICKTTTNGQEPRLCVRDISGPNVSGEKFAVVRETWNEEHGYWQPEDVLLESVEVYNADATNKKGAKGAYCQVFDKYTVRKLTSDFVSDRDLKLVEEWMVQGVPDDICQDDVINARLAKSVLSLYQHNGNTPFEMPVEAGSLKEHQDTLAKVKRGFAVLSGYLLQYGPRCPVWMEPDDAPEDAVVSSVCKSGYVAMTEQHRRWWLIPADLISISEAGKLMYGSNTQSNRVQVADFIGSGELQLFIDKNENNPQHRKRVARQDVERLRGQIYSR